MRARTVVNLPMKLACSFLSDCHCLTKGLFLGKVGSSLGKVRGFLCNCDSVYSILNCSSYSLLFLACPISDLPLLSSSIFTGKL